MKRKATDQPKHRATKRRRTEFSWDNLPIELWHEVQDYLTTVHDQIRLRIASKTLYSLKVPRFHFDYKHSATNMRCYSFSSPGEKQWILQRNAGEHHPRCVMQLSERTLLAIIADVWGVWTASPPSKCWGDGALIRCIGAVQVDDICYFACLTSSRDSGGDDIRFLLLGYDHACSQVTSYVWDDAYPSGGWEWLRKHPAVLETVGEFIVIRTRSACIFFDTSSKQCCDYLSMMPGFTYGPIEFAPNSKEKKVRVPYLDEWCLFQHPDDPNYSHETEGNRYRTWNTPSRPSLQWSSQVFGTM